jgi:hypothetical protein
MPGIDLISVLVEEPSITKRGKSKSFTERRFSSTIVRIAALERLRRGLFNIGIDFEPAI